MATILLVEDEEYLRDCISQMLVRAGHTVHQATGKRALTVLTECPAAIEVLITDVLMPGINGIDVALAVLEKFPSLPVIFMSGYGEEIMKRFPQAPKAVFLAKPFWLSKLLTIVTTITTLRSIKRSSLQWNQIASLTTGQCTLSAELTASYLLEELDEQESELYEAHYFSCPVCAKRLKEFTDVIDVVRLFFPPRWVH